LIYYKQQILVQNVIVSCIVDVNFVFKNKKKRYPSYE
jgi:hypothetical protein